MLSTASSNEECINLSKLSSLRGFIVDFNYEYPTDSTFTPFNWLNNLLRSSYSTSAAHRLETISINIAFDPRKRTDVDALGDVLETLSDSGTFICLKILNISLRSALSYLYPFDWKEHAESINKYKPLERLRSLRPSLTIKVEGKHTTSIPKG